VHCGSEEAGLLITELNVLCAADIRKHKELIEQYDRATGQYVVTIVEKRAG